ncbi:hypothetical protein SISSUDRAFT_1117452 [Sistotremastrum suecicum HHB10207 ss-3]|uniref:F-box domain-containing protein n=1 Tax=Sistotremastrum suecicum HHB10207 ss-3 TaxID=1314776 RepID=A0A166GFZ2_9AGAM|nr:hypothetical protein SISSUDRAFT_1117452 [Sistotremastrum suecicum HHB10207 ss-3]
MEAFQADSAPTKVLPFGQLAPETIIKIISYLSLPEILQLYALSKAWHRFLSKNESYVFHDVAVSHGISLNTESTIEALTQRLGSPLWIKGVRTWKDYCSQRFRMEKGWLGQGRTSIRVYDPDNLSLNSQREREPLALGYYGAVDSEERILISTSSLTGGLTVLCMDTGRTLFQLPKSHVNARARCEFSNGFLILRRSQNALEVWRRASDFNTHPEERPRNGPDELQIRAKRLSENLRSSGNKLPDSPPVTPSRGVFEPWSVLSPEGAGYTFRFIYPYVVEVSANSKEALFWDVRRGLLVRTISIEDPKVSEGRPSPVVHLDFNQTYLFVCRKRLLIFRHGLDFEESDFYTARGMHAHKWADLLHSGDALSYSPVPSKVWDIGENGSFGLKEGLAWPKYALTDRSDLHEGFFEGDLDYKSRDAIIQGPHLSTREVTNALVHMQIESNESNARLSKIDEGTGHLGDVFCLGPSWQEYYEVIVSPDGKDLVLYGNSDYLLYLEHFERLILGEKTFDEIAYWVNIAYEIQAIAFDGKRIVLATNESCFYILTLSKHSNSLLGGDHGTKSPHVEHEGPFSSVARLNYFTFWADKRMQISWMSLTDEGLWFVWDTKADYTMPDRDPQSVVCIDFSPAALA